MMTRLVTDRLMMRRAQPTDLDGFHAVVSDFEVVRMTSSWPWPADRAYTKTRCVPINASNGMAGPVFCKGKIVGIMGALSMYDDGPELGYMFARAHWGQGFATEMARALLDHVWAQYDWDVIKASAYDDNPASVRVLDKLGFHEVEPTIGTCKARGGDFPLRCFQLPRPPLTRV